MNMKGTKSNVARTEGEANEIAGTSNASELPGHAISDIYKLDIDCFHEIFEYLSLSDLLSAAETSRRLQMVAGDFYRSYYPSKKVIAQNGGTFIQHSRSVDIISRFITSVYFACNGLKTYCFVGSNCKSLQQIRFGGPLPERGIEHIKGVLDKIECVVLDECFFADEFYGFFLKHCTNLKSLSVRRSMKVRNKLIIGNSNDWLLRTYPTLEHLELTELYNLDGDELKTFFTQNPNVRTFSTDSHSLWENREAFLACDVTLDKLAVEFTSKDLADSMINLLAQLFDRGFFKRLHVYSTFVHQDHLDGLILHPLSQSLEMLHVYRYEFRMNVCLENLTVLRICNGDGHAFVEQFRTTLPNLERAYFYTISIDDILPLIKYSIKLRTIKIVKVMSIFVEGENCWYSTQAEFDLSMYNRERKKSIGARKVTIYVDESFLLQLNTDYDLVKLKRFEWFDWKGLSSKYRYDHPTHH